MKHGRHEFQNKKGFSFVELLLVIAIISIIAVSSAPFMSRFLAQNQLEVSTDKVVSTIRKAQSYAMANKENAVWGFCMSGSGIRLYKDSCSSSSYNEDFDLTKVTISGPVDVYFAGAAGKRGEPSESATITISNSTGVNTVSINSAGGLSVN